MQDIGACFPRRAYAPTLAKSHHVADLLESEAEEGNWTPSASYKAYTAPVSHTMAIGFPGPLVRPDRPFRICDSRRIDYTSRCPPGQGGLPSDSKEITMKPKLKWLAIVVAVSLLGFGTALWFWPRDRITRRIVAEDPNWDDGRGSDGDSGRAGNKCRGLLERILVEEEEARVKFSRFLTRRRSSDRSRYILGWTKWSDRD